jgi:pilus assembly protein Flp/PilA
MLEYLRARYALVLAAMTAGELSEVAKREEGQALVEYALIIGLIAVAAIAALGFVSGKIQDILSAIGNAL